MEITEDIFEEKQDENVANVGEYWKVGNNYGSYPYVIVETVEEQNVLGVKYFKSSSRGTAIHFKEEKSFYVCFNDLEKKVPLPKEKKQGKRTFYIFEESLQDHFE